MVSGETEYTSEDRIEVHCIYYLPSGYMAGWSSGRTTAGGHGGAGKKKNAQTTTSHANSMHENGEGCATDGIIILRVLQH